jgi:hypothetical protein
MSVVIGLTDCTSLIGSRNQLSWQGDGSAANPGETQAILRAV